MGKAAANTVTIYTSPTDADIKRGSEACSAALAFPKFRINADEVFAAAKV